MQTDGELLRGYAETRSEEAFAELVRRHLDLVHSAALRQVNGDAHLAQDVAQAVFADLARKAGALAGRAVLTGWLYTSTHFAAAKAVRAARRRQVHEQEAHAMRELLHDPTPGPDWDQLRPVLDAAMLELDEADREAVLLRYFEQRPHAEIGAKLGVSENTARMRVERALEKLRAPLARRGVTAAAAALSAAISANAVQVAPAGTAATITTAAALAGTAVQTSTAIAATKAIAMTTMQKTIITATLAVAVGTGIYQARQASHLRGLNLALQQQQSLLAGQLQHAQQQRDDATNRLSAMIVENERLRSDPKATEVLKLRGQVGALRQSLSNTSADGQASGIISKLMNNPAIKENLRRTQLNAFRDLYGPLAAELKLSPTETEQFIQTLTDASLNAADNISRMAQGNADVAQLRQTIEEARHEMESQVQSLLGEAGFARYQEYHQQIPARVTVYQLNTQLGDARLNPEQTAQLMRAVSAEPYNATHGTYELDAAFFGSQPDIDAYLRDVAESHQRILAQAADFLTEQQLAALARVQSNNIAAQTVSGAVLAKKH
jgi:RNA polymerase sigma factor (sigma-70 family)